MALSQKYYEMIASRIAEGRGEVERCVDNAGDATAHVDDMAAHLALDFKRDNPRFDTARFLAACGFDSDEAQSTARQVGRMLLSEQPDPSDRVFGYAGDGVIAAND